MPKHPCIGCVYFKVCGNSNRTEPCEGRATKTDRKNAGFDDGSDKKIRLKLF